MLRQTTTNWANPTTTGHQCMYMQHIEKKLCMKKDNYTIKCSALWFYPPNLMAGKTDKLQQSSLTDQQRHIRRNRQSCAIILTMEPKLSSSQRSTHDVDSNCTGSVDKNKHPYCHERDRQLSLFSGRYKFPIYIGTFPFQTKYSISQQINSCVQCLPVLMRLHNYSTSLSHNITTSIMMSVHMIKAMCEGGKKKSTINRSLSHQSRLLTDYKAQIQVLRKTCASKL